MFYIYARGASLGGKRLQGGEFKRKEELASPVRGGNPRGVLQKRERKDFRL